MSRRYLFDKYHLIHSITFWLCSKIYCTIVATGTPEEIAEAPDSYTGKYLKKVLERDKAVETK